MFSNFAIRIRRSRNQHARSSTRGSYVKNLVSLVLASSLGFGLLGCSLPTNENPPEQQGFDFKPGEKAQCLANVLPTLQGFVNGDASSGEVEQVWDCFRVALNLFSSYIRGREDNRYSSRELANFFERYFFKNVKISDRLLVEIMRIKQIFVGGENETLTREELFKLMKFAEDMKVISLRLLPYMKVYSQNWTVSKYRSMQADVHYFEDANQAIQDAAKDLAALIAKNDKSYVIADFSVLLEEVSHVYGQDWNFVQKLKKVMPLVHTLKKTLAGGEETSVAPNEWRRFALLGARGYIQYLRYHYFIDTSDDLGGGPELVYLARSVDDLFSYLGDMVAEKPLGVFTRAELLEVFNALGQFFPGVKASDPFLVEVMKIKILLFGGSLDNFTPVDFQRARGKVEAFRAVTEKLLVYSNVYGLSWQPFLGSYDEAYRYYKSSDTALLEIAKSLGEIIESGYDLNDLLTLANEFEKLYPPDVPTLSVVSALKKFLPVIVTARQILFSDDKSTIARGQWTPFLVTAGQFYGRYLQAYYFLLPAEISWSHGSGLDSLSSFMDDALSNLNSLIGRKPGLVVSFKDFDKLTSALGQAKLLPDILPVPTLNNLLRVVFQKILVRPEVRLAGTSPQGLGGEALAVIREEFNLWRSNQKYLESIYRDYPQGQMLEGSKILTSLKTQPYNVGLAELIAIYSSPQSRAFDSAGRLAIWQEPAPYSIVATDTVNLSRMISRVLMRSYAQDIDRIKRYSGINLAETNQFFTDIRPIAISLGLLEESNTTFASSRFREAGLFTPRADGDDLANFVEFADLSLGIMSGLKLDKFVQEKLKSPASGCPIVVKGNANDDKISVKCFANTYVREMGSIFASMPSMKAFMLKLPRCELLTEKPWLTDAATVKATSAAEIAPLKSEEVAAYVASCNGSFDLMLLNMLKSAGYVAEKRGVVSLQITSLVPHVMQYIETIVQRYDRIHVGTDGQNKPKDGILDNIEAVDAYPVLRKVLIDVSGYKDEKTLRGLLAWIMERGKPPETTWEKVSFLSYINFPEKWNIKTDRALLASILGYIADAVAPKTGAKLAAQTAVLEK